MSKYCRRFFIMKKLLVTLALLGLFIGGSNLNGYDVFIVNDNVKKTSVGVVMKDGHREAIVTGKPLQDLYDKMLREHKEKIIKDLGQGGTKI